MDILMLIVALKQNIFAALLTSGRISVLEIEKQRLCPWPSFFPLDPNPNKLNKFAQRQIEMNLESAVTNTV